jgi:peptide/nickel transport system substrate-binding protein
MIHATRARRGLLLVVLPAFFGCSGDNGAGERAAGDTPSRGGTLVIGGPNDLGGLNALVATETYTQEIISNVLFLPLLRLDEAGDYTPALAREWEWEGDTAVTFQLRDDVRWHDGARTSAWDVAFTFERAIDPATAFPNATDLAPWKHVSVTDSFTVRFGVEPHVEPLLTWVFLPIMPKHALDSIPAARMQQAAFNYAPIGNGPFRFVEYQAGDRWIFAANEEFPESLGGRPWLDRVVWRVIPENSAQVTELRTGGVDLILSPRAEDLAQLEADPGIRAIIKPSRQYQFVGWNGRREPLGDARVRRALSLALDRPEILDVLRGGYGTLAAGPIDPSHWAYPDAVQPLSFDTIAARALLAEAGIADRTGDGILDLPNGRPFDIELKIPANSAFNRDLAQIVQADLAAIGVRVNIRTTEFATLINDISSPARNFDAVLMAWDADLRLNLRDLFHSEAIGGPYQLASYANAEIDALLDELAGIRDRATALPRWHRVQAIMRDEQPWTFLWYVPNLYAARDRVQGIEMDVRGAFRGIAGWWIDTP